MSLAKSGTVIPTGTADRSATAGDNSGNMSQVIPPNRIGERIRFQRLAYRISLQRLRSQRMVGMSMRSPEKKNVPPKNMVLKVLSEIANSVNLIATATDIPRVIMTLKDELFIECVGFFYDSTGDVKKVQNLPFGCRL